MFGPGPLFTHELVRVARKQKLALFRSIYPLVLLFLVGILYFAALETRVKSFADFLTATDIPARDLAGIAAGFAGIFLVVQFLVVAFGTPANAVGVFAEERERQTLPFLLMTTLSNRDILGGKLLARLAQMAMFLAAGVPVLAIMQTLGGIEPRLLFGVTLATLSTMLSIASLGAVASLYSPTTKLANQRLAGGLFGALALMSSLWFLLHPWFNLPGGPVVVLGQEPVYVEDVIDWLNLANPASTTFRGVFVIATRNGRFEDVLFFRVGMYCLLHGVVTLAALAWVNRHLRRVAAEVGDGVAPPAPKPKRKAVVASVKPPMNDIPIFWRDLYCKPPGRIAPASVNRLLYVLSLPVMFVLPLLDRGPRSQYLADASNGMTRGFVTIGLCIGIMHVLGNTASSIWREAKQRTLDDILLTDLSAGEIVAQKAAAALVKVRWLWLWAAVSYVAAILYGGLSPLAVPVIVVMAAVYYAFAAAVGVYFAARVLHPTMPGGLAMLVCLATAGGPWFLVGLLAMNDRFPRHALEVLGPFCMGWSPPVALGSVAFRTSDFEHLKADNLVSFAAGLASSMTVHGVAAVMLYRAACRLVARNLRP